MSEKQMLLVTSVNKTKSLKSQVTKALNNKVKFVFQSQEVDDLAKFSNYESFFR
jgi:hypothetical protein